MYEGGCITKLILMPEMTLKCTTCDDSVWCLLKLINMHTVYISLPLLFVYYTAADILDNNFKYIYIANINE